MDYRKFSRTKNVGMPIEQRFWEKVDKRGPNECWEWLGAHQAQGYGVLRIDKSNSARAHRLSYEFHFGKFPQEMFVCHKCDNPKCVNPRHLFLGTLTANAYDAIDKGRAVNPPRKLGEAHHNSILTSESVRKIRTLKAAGHSHLQIAKQFGVNKATIKDIISGRTWSHMA